MNCPGTSTGQKSWSGFLGLSSVNNIVIVSGNIIATLDLLAGGDVGGAGISDGASSGKSTVNTVRIVNSNLTAVGSSYGTGFGSGRSTRFEIKRFALPRKGHAMCETSEDRRVLRES
jgi:hypothetical protein